MSFPPSQPPLPPVVWAELLAKAPEPDAAAAVAEKDRRREELNLPQPLCWTLRASGLLPSSRARRPLPGPSPPGAHLGRAGVLPRAGKARARGPREPQSARAMGPPPGAGVLCRGGCGFSRLLAWCFLLALSPHAPGSRGAEAVWTAYLNVSWRVPHTGVNRTVWELSEEGVYGQDSPLEPVAGVLVPPDGPGALNACNPHTNFTVPTVPGDWGSSVQVSWLALIQRGGGCTFADKIHLAYERGASGAVIFNFPGTRNEVIPMSHPGECSYYIEPHQPPTKASFCPFFFPLFSSVLSCSEGKPSALSVPTE